MHGTAAEDRAWRLCRRRPGSPASKVGFGLSLLAAKPIDLELILFNPVRRSRLATALDFINMTGQGWPSGAAAEQ